MSTSIIRPDFERPILVRDLWTPLGTELRVIDEHGELLYSQAFPDGDQLISQAAEWKAGKISRGWIE